MLLMQLTVSRGASVARKTRRKPPFSRLQEKPKAVALKNPKAAAGLPCVRKENGHHLARSRIARSRPSSVSGYIRPSILSRTSSIELMPSQNCSGTGLSHAAFG
jgi:hypothetical protein